LFVKIDRKVMEKLDNPDLGSVRFALVQVERHVT
jgi:hypothetical protein